MKVLGLNFTGFHDSAACIAQDGEFLFAASEERFSRVPHDGRFPHSAIQQCLEYSNIQPAELDYAVIGWSSVARANLWDAYFSLRTLSVSAPEIVRFLFEIANRCWTKGGFRTYQRLIGDTKNHLFCDHHLAHALSSYCCSPFDEASVLVVDGRGAFEATSIWHAKGGRIEPVQIIKWPDSLGLLYLKFTKYLGFRPVADEWKVMGLAAYGNPGVDLSAFVDNSQKPYHVHWRKIFGKNLFDFRGIERILGPARAENEAIEQRHKDIAYALQRLSEQAMLSTAEYAIKKTGVGNLCLAGGVALNCKANGRIANAPFVENIFVQPASSDDGVALGSALYPYMLAGGELPRKEMQEPYLGPSFQPKEIEAVLKKYKLSYERMENHAQTCAQLIAAGKIIGRFDGRMEFGPRALGNRSILGDPRDPEIKSKINNSVKYREDWRPFAPSILEEHYHEFFNTRFKSPFMILSFPVNDGMRDLIPAGTHVDGTARPQTVSRAVTPRYWEVIDEFRKITGVPLVVNTSFNLRGEPIVCTPSDAIRTFFSSGLDALVLGDFLLLKSA